MNWIGLVVIFITISRIQARPKNIDTISTRKCGYEGCPRTSPDQLNIHLVPHTHDDVGWLKTVDQYYYGSSSMIQKAGVQYILDSVVHELLRDPNKRFVYVESAFFFKWWDEQTTTLQLQVKQLVEEGRLEFIGGGWSMNDEGTTHYQSLIDQFAWGLRKLNDTFGKCGRPRIGWQIDPFGHSREMASIFAGMGYDGMFFARLDWQDKGRRLVNQKGEMIWQASPNLGDDADLFTGILSNHYSAPPGFCFDYLCNDEPIIDDDLGFGFENNVVERLDTFYRYITAMTQFYATNNLMVPMGDDFNYQDANMNFKNMDKLIKYSKGRKVNGKEVNIFYSTPSCYLKSLHETENMVWPAETEDFFPYSTDPHTFWSGYFTSRPTLKRFERIGHNFLQVCKQLNVLYQLNQTDSSLSNNLTPLREAMGIMQHHDAITGTEKEKVADDYARILYHGIKVSADYMKTVLNKIINPNQKYQNQLDFNICLDLNVSACEITENSNRFMVTLYNPLMYSVDEYIRIPVHEGQFTVKDPLGNAIQHQIVPIQKNVLDIPNRFSIALNELIFKASVTTLNSYLIEKTSANAITNPISNAIPKLSNEINDEIVVVENSNIRLQFVNDILASIRIHGKELQIAQEFFYYEGAYGNNLEFANRSSGAYIFRPNGTAQPITIEGQIELTVIDGDLVKEIHQKFLNWNASQIIRIYDTESYVEFEWLVGPIPTDDNIGKELITRYTTNMKTNGIFYTDSNGREMIQRKRNYDVKELISANYYPVTAKISIESDTERLSILNDRAQGGSSLADGQIELMIHRRLLHDDAFGVGEALNEKAFGTGVVARGKHYLLFGANKTELRIQEAKLQVKKLLAPWPFFSHLDMSSEQWQQDIIKNDFIGFDKYETVHLVSYESWGDNQILVRLENILEKTTDSNLADSIKKINIKNLLERLNGIEIRETTLDGNQWLDETHRLKFNYTQIRHTDNSDLNSHQPLHIIGVDAIRNFKDEIELKPMQIRTFIVRRATK